LLKAGSEKNGVLRRLVQVPQRTKLGKRNALKVLLYPPIAKDIPSPLGWVTLSKPRDW
jgi:hypothetical protein